MANYTGPKVRLSRRVGVPIEAVDKHASNERVRQPPGIHGGRGRRPRDYGIRLTEKQKLRFHYNVGEKQFRRFVKEAKRLPGNSGDMLLVLLERRLDNVIRRMGIARTIWAARQMVAHGHVLVDGRKTDRPSFMVKPGMEISIKEKTHKLCRENMESLPGHEVPEWISLNPGELKAKIVSVPRAEEIPFRVNTNLVIEFYRF